MAKVSLEVKTNGGWGLVGAVGDGDPPGSISSTPEAPKNRKVYLWGWHGGVPGVWESTRGIDIEDPATRLLVTTGLEQLSDLSEPFELDIWRLDNPIRVRFTLEQ